MASAKPQGIVVADDGLSQGPTTSRHPSVFELTASPIG
jgi:hypothetical protein